MSCYRALSVTADGGHVKPQKRGKRRLYFPAWNLATCRYGDKQCPDNPAPDFDATARLALQANTITREENLCSFKGSSSAVPLLNFQTMQWYEDEDFWRETYHYMFPADTVFPFILRNVSLLGINSVQAPKSLRIEAWSRLVGELPMAKLDAITTLEPLSKVKELSEKILAGQVRGRVVLDVNA